MRYISGRNYQSSKGKKYSAFRNRAKKRVKHPTNHAFALPEIRSSGRRGIRAKSVPWVPFFLFFSIVSWLLLLVYLPFFQISRVSYSGLQLIKKDEMQQVLQTNFLTGSRVWPKGNYYLVSASSIEKYLTKNYALNFVEVKKVFPNSLEITVEEKVTAIIYDNGTNYYLVDRDGTINRKLTSVARSEYVSPEKGPKLANFLSSITATNTTTVGTTTPPLPIHVPNYLAIRRAYGLYPVVYQETFDTTVSEPTFVDPSVVQGVIDMYGAIEKSHLALPNYVVMGDTPAGAALISNQPWNIYFQPSANISEQIGNIKTILQNNKPTDYIDVRYGDHVYWK